MAISTNSIIHYTSSINTLKSIISEGFRVKYCLEKLKIKGGARITGAFPMICFCDIPLSSIKNHLESYGSYGLGLNKNWATRNGLNPVLYIDQSADIGQIIQKQIKGVQNENGEIDHEYLKDFIKICSYLKNYDGPLIRGDKNEENYRFYDEREWRYVPPKELLGNHNVLAEEIYLADKKSFNEFVKDILLNFSFEDISYIIVKSEEDIIEMTKHLRNTYADRCTATQLEVLLTKIITSAQIISDF